MAVCPRAGQSPLGQHRQPWKSNAITPWGGKTHLKTPFCRVNPLCAHSTCGCSRPPEMSPESITARVEGKKGCVAIFSRQNTGRSVRGRKRALLSSSEDKRALWLWPGPKGVPSAPAQLGRGSGTGRTVTARSPSWAPASPTESKSNRKSCKTGSVPRA